MFNVVADTVPAPYAMVPAALAVKTTDVAIIAKTRTAHKNFFKLFICKTFLNTAYLPASALVSQTCATSIAA